jgi:hypothetical protein
MRPAKKCHIASVRRGKVPIRFIVRRGFESPLSYAACTTAALSVTSVSNGVQIHRRTLGICSFAVHAGGLYHSGTKRTQEVTSVWATECRLAIQRIQRASHAACSILSQISPILLATLVKPQPDRSMVSSGGIVKKMSQLNMVMRVYCVGKNECRFSAACNALESIGRISAHYQITCR